MVKEKKPYDHYHRKKIKFHYSDDGTFENIRCGTKSHPNAKPEDFHITKVKTKCTCLGCLRSLRYDHKLLKETLKKREGETRGMRQLSDLAKLHTPHRATCKAAQMVKDGKWESVWSGVIRGDEFVREYRTASGAVREGSNKTLWYLVSCNEFNCSGMKLVSSKVLQDAMGPGL